jgi:glucose-1-phosphate thymidylyltransferase
MNRRKGIILAGGTGSRLYPLTIGVSKQLLPIYDKPMIYYPLTILMLSGINEIAIIVTPQDRKQYESLLGNGEQWGVSFQYIEQLKPDGIAQAYTLTRDFLSGSPSALVLGDNIFYGQGLSGQLKIASERKLGGTVFGYQVIDPERYGVVEFNSNGKVESIKEKPKNPTSNYAVTGLYFLDSTASERVESIIPSARGELEITDLLESYLSESALEVELLGRGFSWLDTGTHDSLIEASEFVKTVQKRQGFSVGCPEEVALLKGWINKEKLEERLKNLPSNNYSNYLRSLLK